MLLSESCDLEQSPLLYLPLQNIHLTQITAENIGYLFSQAFQYVLILHTNVSIARTIYSFIISLFTPTNPSVFYVLIIMYILCWIVDCFGPMRCARHYRSVMHYYYY